MDAIVATASVLRRAISRFDRMRFDGQVIFVWGVVVRCICLILAPLFRTALNIYILHGYFGTIRNNG